MLETIALEFNTPKDLSTMTQPAREAGRAEIAVAARAANATATANTGLEAVSTSRSARRNELSTLSRTYPGGFRAMPTTFRVSDLSTWTGRVVDVDEEMFTAELIPGERTPGGTVLADFNRALVVDEDETLQIGDVIYVTSRMVRAPHGGRSETSSVRLRRLGKWTAEDVALLTARADSLADSVADLFD